MSGNDWIKTVAEKNKKKNKTGSSGIFRREHTLGEITSESCTQVDVLKKSMIKQAEEKIKGYKEELNEVCQNLHIAWNRNRLI